MLNRYCILPLVFCAGAFAAAFSGGSGSAQDPYRISTVGDVYQLSQMSASWGAYFVLENDIDLTNLTQDFVPIGNMTNRFQGSFNGQGNTIKRLFIDQTEQNSVGFFGALGSEAVIEQLNFTNAVVNINRNPLLRAGIIAGYNAGKIINCSISGLISAQSTTAYAGLIAGDNAGEISGCTVAGTLSTNYCGGGVSGYNDGLIYQTTSNVTVIVGGAAPIVAWAGGIAGISGADSSIISSSSSGIVDLVVNQPTREPQGFAGGIVGEAGSGALIRLSWSSCDVKSIVTAARAITYAGGVCGRSGGAIFEGCYALGQVNAESNSSGLPSLANAGGFYGQQISGSVSNSFAMGKASAKASGGSPNSSNSGGFAGRISGGEVLNSYSIGEFSSTQYRGGFCGLFEGGSATGCFWDIQSSGSETGIGRMTGGAANITGETTQQMKTQSTFTAAGWDFTTIWQMSDAGSEFDGYPVLTGTYELPDFDILEIPIIEGWNWISFNVLPENTSLAAVFSGYNPTNSDVIVTSDGTNATFYDGSWYGTLAEIQAGLKYRLRSHTEQTFTVQGAYVAQDTQIQLVSGWNWLGYCLAEAEQLEQALASLQVNDSDVILAPDGKNATYFQGQWYGTLTELKPGVGYLLKLSSPQTFSYANAGGGQALATANAGFKGYDMRSFSALSANWLFDDCGRNDWCDGADMDFSGSVDFDDLLILIDGWLR